MDMAQEPDELDRMVTELFIAWKEDIESVPQPILVTDEEAVEIIAAAALRIKRKGFPSKKIPRKS